jgi:hypothetical protein
MMMYNGMMDNFLPAIIDRLLWLHRDMRGNTDTREVLMRLERRSLRSRLQNPLAN